MEERVFLRFGAGAAVAGAVLGLVGNVLHPRYGDLSDVELYRRIATNNAWVPADLLILAALVLSVAGIVAVARSLRGGGANESLADWARLGAVAGGAIAIAQTGVDAFALRQAARAFAGAADPDVVGAFWATNAIDKLSTALFATWTLVLLGIVPLLLAVAAVRTRRYPWAVSGMAGVGGLGCAVVAVVNLVRVDQSATEIPFLVASVLVTAWLLLSGLLLWEGTGEERAGQPTGRPATA